ncbi:hypothetical protein [Nocardia fusca]|uniref:hypothetical protein n=1 Tax=Nocardia fusca TaxID=941183 RepID=UPI0012F47ACC|nr:hypothetical protein [Nocardia fusca]
MEQGNPDSHRTSAVLGAGAYLLRVLAVSTGVALALYTAVYWTLIMTDSVSDYLAISRGGAGPADTADAAVGAQTALTTTIVTILIQSLALAGIALAITRVHGASPLHRLPNPPESHPRRWLYAAGIFAAAALIAALAFNGPGAAARAGEPDSDPGRLAGIRILLAGALEEPFFAALPVLVLSALPVRWTTNTRGAVALALAITISAAGRGAIHLYQASGRPQARCSGERRPSTSTTATAPSWPSSPCTPCGIWARSSSTAAVPGRIGSFSSRSRSSRAPQSLRCPGLVYDYRFPPGDCPSPHQSRRPNTRKPPSTGNERRRIDGTAAPSRITCPTPAASPVATTTQRAGGILLRDGCTA